MNKKNTKLKRNLPKVVAIVTTINLDKKHTRFIKECLEKLQKTNYDNLITYVLDNGSPKKIHEFIKKKFSWVKFILKDRNLGFAIGNNLVIKIALKEENPDYIILLNDDNVFIDPSWLKIMINEAEAKLSTGVIGCRNLYPNKSDQWIAKKGKLSFFKIPGHKEKSKEIYKTQIVNNIVGNCFLIKREVINKIGLLDEKLSPFYGEETDFCLRAQKAGYKNLYVGKTYIIHHRDQSISLFNEDEIWFIQLKNAIRMEWLNYSLLKILKSSFSHFLSWIFTIKNKKLVLRKNILKKLRLLFKAYFINFNNLKEITIKHKKRNSWEKI